ncbi:MAG: general secretion pathway protein GspL [Rhodovulum sulfidophilum]|uniref:General secretion pathway protein GspL n=1 Tax=Rhodovulum sulfidophilum TaxID=35806 RepID=A0A2W5NA87_RHOSU|nr:MAG: general secretion pathway protein GspL [Rhodovulum sulfidophilum]
MRASWRPAGRPGRRSCPGRRSRSVAPRGRSRSAPPRGMSDLPRGRAR